MNRLQSIFFFFTLLMIISSCGSDKGKNIPDVSDITPEFSIVRFEQELFAIDTNNIQPQLVALENKYPAFFDLYFTYIIPFKNQSPAVPAKNEAPVDPNEFLTQVEDFLKSEAIRNLKDTTDIVFNNFETIEKEFYQGFQFYKHYFPERDIPNVYTLLSEFAFQVFVFEDENKKDGIGVSLDFFLGDKFPYQRMNPRNPAFSGYLTRSFNKDHLVKKAFDAYTDDMVPSPNGNRLLDIMVQNGKKLYILDHLLPYAQDSVKLEYTEAQLDWVNENEFNMWAHLIDEELLYSSNVRDIQKLINPSPHSTGMPPEAPGRTANWVGWQIVKSYMKWNPETTMTELIELNDAQALLDRSKYKPRR